MLDQIQRSLQNIKTLRDRNQLPINPQAKQVQDLRNEIKKKGNRQ